MLPTYRGRFAPTPSGPLHLGSLTTAVASWLDARAHHGQWLVRIEDVDHPRSPPGTSDLILRQLAAYGLEWDGEVSFQHDHDQRYQEALNSLIKQHQAYDCSCSRKEWQSYPHYPGWCRQGNRHPERPAAWRLNTDRRVSSQTNDIEWKDLRLGLQRWSLGELGDVILKRKDGLWAYQLAVVVDDAAEGITHIIRGADLLDNTPWQIRLQENLGFPIPQYAHMPLVLAENGQKLSKQNLAPALPNQPRAIRHTLHHALQQLGLVPPGALQQECIEAQLNWALAHWTLTQAESSFQNKEQTRS